MNKANLKKYGLIYFVIGILASVFVIVMIAFLVKLGQGYERPYWEDSSSMMTFIRSRDYQNIAKNIEKYKLYIKKPDATTKEYFAVGDYYNNKVMYEAFKQKDESKAQTYYERMNVAASGLGNYQYCSSEIDEEISEALERAGQTEAPQKTAEQTEATTFTETEGLYMSFLHDEEVLYFDEKKSINIDYIFDEFVPEENQLDYSKGYTLDETIDLLSGAIGEGCKIGTCQYYMIDAGQDGNPEMCIELSNFEAADWGNITLLIKEIDEKLCCRYCLVTRARFGYDITYDGVISGGGAGGAGYHVYDECFIDADGECRFLYKSESLYPGYDSYISDAFQIVSPNLMDKLDSGYYIETMVAGFEDKTPTEDCVLGLNIYDTDFNLIEESEPIYDEIRQLFSDGGISILSAKEFASAIDERCLNLGVTTEMRNSFDKRKYQVLF